jgi:hypothetical protein
MASQFTLLGTHIQGVLNGIIDAVNGKAPSSHNHDDRYYTETETNNLLNTKVAVDGSTMTGNINWAQTDRGLTWAFNTDGAYIKFFNTGDGDTNSRLENLYAGVYYATGGNSTNWNTAYGWGNNYISDVRLSESNLEFTGEGSAFTGTIDLSGLPFQPAGSYLTSLPAHTHDDRYYTETESDARYPLSRGVLGTTTNVGDSTGFGNNLASGTYTRTYVGHSGQVWMSHDTGGSTGNFALEVTYYGAMYVHTNVDSSSWVTKQIWTAENFTLTNISNWNTAYGWGNHADYEYWNTDSVDAKNVQSAEVAFAGNVTVEGTFTESSSIRLKENITPLDPALDKVNQLEAVSYNKIGADDREVGLIAEDVAELFPEVVTYNEEGQPQGIQYQRLSVILLKAVQEQNAVITALTERVNKLENK